MRFVEIAAFGLFTNRDSNFRLLNVDNGKEIYPNSEMTESERSDLIWNGDVYDIYISKSVPNTVNVLLHLPKKGA